MNAVDWLVSIGWVLTAIMFGVALNFLIPRRFREIPYPVLKDQISQIFREVEQKRAATSATEQPAMLRIFSGPDPQPPLGWILEQFQQTHQAVQGYEGGPRADLKVMVGPLGQELATHKEVLLEINNDPLGDHLRFYDETPGKGFIIINDEVIILLEKEGRVRLARNPMRARSFKDSFDRIWAGQEPNNSRRNEFLWSI